MEPRAVSAGHGWTWILEGYSLFRKSPAAWLSLLLLLFVSGAVLMRVPVLGIVFVLLMPVFVVGLMEGCRALEQGERLEIAHLVAGFRRNAAQLVTIGGITLMGNLLVMMIVVSVGGETLAAMVKAVQQGATLAPQVQQEAGAAVRRALLVGIIASLPLLMALWYAPLLVHFQGFGPLSLPRRVTPRLAPWKLTFMPALKLALNEKGEKTNSASIPSQPWSLMPKPLARRSMRAPICAVFDVSAK